MNELVEQIVREVMARLQAAGDSSTGSVERSNDLPSGNGMAVQAGTGVPPSKGPASEERVNESQSDRRVVEDRGPLRRDPPQSNRTPDDLVVAKRVITTADLPEHWNGIRSLRVPAGAIVTPAVRDELERRRVALRYLGPNEPSMAAARLRLEVVIHRQCVDENGIRSGGLKELGLNVVHHECVIAACDAAARAARDDQRPAVVATCYAAAAVCLANRIPQIRAITAADPAELETASSMVGANVLILDPTRTGVFGFHRLLKLFAAIGGRPCPRELGPRLN